MSGITKVSPVQLGFVDTTNRFGVATQPIKSGRPSFAVGIIIRGTFGPQVTRTYAPIHFLHFLVLFIA
jgi:hypothetical protein